MERVVLFLVGIYLTAIFLLSDWAFILQAALIFLSLVLGAAVISGIISGDTYASIRERIDAFSERVRERVREEEETQAQTQA